MVKHATLPRNETGIETAVGVLKQQFGERLQTGQSVCEQHGHTTTWIENQPPDAVVFVHSTQEVSDVVRSIKFQSFLLASGPLWKGISMPLQAAYLST